MVFDSAMTNYPPFYDLLLMVFSLLSHPESSFLGSAPLEIVAKGYRILELEVRKTASCPAMTEDLSIVHLDHN